MIRQYSSYPLPWEGKTPMCHTKFRIVNNGNIKIWSGITGMQFICLCCTLGRSFKVTWVTILCMGYFTACLSFWQHTLGNILQSKDLSCWNQNGKIYLLSYIINQFLYSYLGVPVIFMSISKCAPLLIQGIARL
jgi:hypothetical protein